MKEILSVFSVVLLSGVLIFVGTRPDRGGNEKFGFCRLHPSGAKECLMTFTEKQWRFLGNICDK